VINVRGSVVPVVDLRLKLGMSRTEKSINTCIVVLDLAGTEGVLTLGVLVDAVQEVVEFDSSRIEPPPRLGTAVRSEFLTGIGKREDRFIMLLDVKNVFAEGELGELARVEASGSRE
jgi:purine-binding chemotaxis protein CheW